MYLDLSDRSIPNNNAHDEGGDGALMDCMTLTGMLQRASNKIPHVILTNFDDDDEVSPEYLSLLIALFKKAHLVELSSFSGDAAFSCLKSSLLQNDGPRELIFNSSQFVSLHQAELLGEGIALSPFLESLSIRDESDDEPQVDIGAVLTEPIRRNSGLKCLGLRMNIFRSASSAKKFFKETILGTKVEILKIGGAFEEDFSQLSFPFEVFAEVFCQKECSLKSLHFGYSLDTIPSQREETETKISTKNSSVTNFNVLSSPLDCSSLMETVGMFQSLVSLKIVRCHSVSDLSALDPLLIGDNLTLKSLILDQNKISAKDIIVFLRKVPEMKCLECLESICNPSIIV